MLFTNYEIVLLLCFSDFNPTIDDAVIRVICGMFDVRKVLACQTHIDG